MKTDGGETAVFDKPRRPKSREVSSRFLSPPSSATPSIDTGLSSPSNTVSPLRQKSRSSTDTRKHRSLEDSGFIRRLWPSSTPKSLTSSKSNSNTKPGTLADHLGNERLKDHIDPKKHDHNSDNSMSLNRQSSCSEFNRFKNEKESTKENHKPLFGGSMRYTGKFRFPGRSSTSSLSSSKPSTTDDDLILPGRLSVDENALRRKLSGRISDTLSDAQESESESSEVCSGTSFNSPLIGKSLPASYMSSTVSSRKYGIEVASKYMIDKPRRSDSNIPTPVSSDNSPKKSILKNPVRRANSLTTTYGSVTSKWAMSPGRSGSPPMTVENKGVPVVSFSTLKPPTSTSRAKGVGNLLSLGLDLFKSRKSTVGASSPLGPGTVESVHQLRLMHNRWAQWRYANARVEAATVNIATQAESNLLYAWDGLTKLQHSVIQKRLQLQKEKLDMKLDLLLHSQNKPLEAWGDMERQHLSAVSKTIDCLHSVVCKVPLIEGAQVEPQSASIALRHASDIAAFLKSIIPTFSPMAEKTVSILSELAEVAAQEKSMLEECLDLFRIISMLEIEERSLKCNMIQMKLLQQHQQHQQEISA